MLSCTFLLGRLNYVFVWVSVRCLFLSVRLSFSFLLGRLSCTFESLWLVHFCEILFLRVFVSESCVGCYFCAVLFLLTSLCIYPTIEQLISLNLEQMKCSIISLMFPKIVCITIWTISLKSGQNWVFYVNKFKSLVFDGQSMVFQKVASVSGNNSCTLLSMWTGRIVFARLVLLSVCLCGRVFVWMYIFHYLLSM